MFLISFVAQCHNRVLVIVGQQLCDTCSNQANKSALRNSNVANNVNVCAGLESRYEKMFRKHARENTLETGLKN